MGGEAGRTYRNAAYPFLGGALIVGILALTASYVASPMSVVSKVVVVLGACAISWVVYRFYVRARVLSDASGIIVVNPFSTVILTWSEVTGCWADDRLIIERAMGDPIGAWAVQAANAARMLGRRSFADDVAEDLNRLKLEYGSPPGEAVGTEP